MTFNLDIQYPSSISLAHEALYKAQEKKKSWLDYGEIISALQVPGIQFESGTTIDNVIKKLEDYNFIKYDPDKKRIFVLSAGWY